jgi:hypothetical protein
MNLVLKSAVAGALALGATGAFAAGVGIPSSNNSDVILYVDAYSTGATPVSTGVYALDTGISLSSLLPGPYVTSANNSTVFSAPSTTIAASTALQGFMSSHAGNTFQWTVMGGQYFGAKNPTSHAPNTTNTTTPGAALVVFSSGFLSHAGSPVKTTATQMVMNTFLSNYGGDLGPNGGLKGLTPETGGAKEIIGTESISTPSHYTWTTGPDLAIAGDPTKVDLFGFTGNNNGSLVQQYMLGSAAFSANGTLTISGNTTTSPVPLPAAVWLFGSGLMGLVGVSRRRKTTVAA